MQRPKLGRGSLTVFPMNSFPVVWAVSPMNPNFFPTKSITELKRRQSLWSCRSTSFQAAVLSEECVDERPDLPWVRLRHLEAHSLAVLWLALLKANETAKLVTTLARFQGLTSIRVPSRSPATKKWTESCSSTPFCFGIAYFLHVKYPRSPLNAPKIWSCSCVCNTNQSMAICRSRSIPTPTSVIFTCGEKLHQSTNLPTFHCICRTVVACSWAGGSAWTSGSHTTE